MAYSSSNVTDGDDVLASQYNNIRADLTRTIDGNGNITADIVNEKNTGSGVTIDNALIKDGAYSGTDGTFTGTVQAGTVKSNTLSEKNAGSGVTIDNMKIKDGKIETANSVVEANYTDGSIKNEHINSSAEIARSKMQGVIGNAHGGGDAEKNRKMDWGSWWGQTYKQVLDTQLSYVEVVVLGSSGGDHGFDVEARDGGNNKFSIQCDAANIPFYWVAIGY